MIEVVSGILMRHDERGEIRMLLTQRGGRSAFSHHWEFPGGKVEPNEHPMAALSRELMEEVGCVEIRGRPMQMERKVRIQVGPSPQTYRSFEPLADLPEFTVEDVCIAFYLVDVDRVDWTPVLGDNVIGVGWFTLREARQLQSTPGNVEVYRQLGPFVR